MKFITESKNSSSFEVVLIDDHHGSDSNSRPMAPEVERTLSPKDHGCIHLSPRGRLLALACYLLISGLLSLYFCLVQAGMKSIEVCGSVASCFLYSTQGWPALGEQSVDLLVVSYFSGSVSVLGGILGAFGLYAVYKESASKVQMFAKIWRSMIGCFISCTVLILFCTFIHKEQFLSQCAFQRHSALDITECSTMYVAVLIGSIVSFLIGLTMNLRFGEDVIKYFVELETVK